MVHPAIKAGNVALITGAGYGGIGYGLASYFASQKLRLALIDVSKQHLDEAVSNLKLAEQDILPIQADVSSQKELESAAEQIKNKFGKLNVLCLNAAAGDGGVSTWNGSLDGWTKTLGINLFGVIQGSLIFSKMVVDSNEPGFVMVTGSKQGITNPPTGNAAYNTSKAAVKAFTEQLAHELREATDKRVTAHLLVPGWTFTKMTRGNRTEKPDGAWYPEQVVDYAMTRVDRGDFYIICPDNDATSEMDQARMEWSATDPAKNRPALSRWHKDHKSEFEAFMKEKTGK